MALSFSEKHLKKKYSMPIDITDFEGRIINVSINIRSPLSKIKFSSPHELIYQKSVFDNPIVDIHVTAHSNTNS